MRRPDPNSAVPAARAEAVFGNEIPVHTEHLALVLLPLLDGEFIRRAVEELDAAVSRAHKHLIFVKLRPG